MTHEGGTHGPRQDDALKRETRSEVRARRATRTEEWREPEPAGEDQPDATWAPEGKPGSGEGGEDPDGIQLRSDLARYLGRATFPASREDVLDTLASHQAPQRLADLVGRLPAGASLASFAALAEALGLPLERRPG
jgi:hypothetical protein